MTQISCIGADPGRQKMNVIAIEVSTAAVKPVRLLSIADVTGNVRDELLVAPCESRLIQWLDSLVRIGQR